MKRPTATVAMMKDVLERQRRPRGARPAAIARLRLAAQRMSGYIAVFETEDGQRYSPSVTLFVRLDGVKVKLFLRRCVFSVLCVLVDWSVPDDHQAKESNDLIMSCRRIFFKVSFSSHTMPRS